MNTILAEGVDLAVEVRDATASVRDVDVMVLPPFTHLLSVSEALRGSSVMLGAQNAHWEKSGAFTGEISVTMLGEFCTHVLLGHSERRHVMGESDAVIAKKVHTVLDAGMRLILAVGETESERDADHTAAVITRQLDSALASVGADAYARIDIAYEPVWAIGTGKTATADQAQDVCGMIRAWLTERTGAAADRVRILYGGSVTAGNAPGLFAQPDIDGGLIGGASLKPKDFAAIVAAAA